MLGNLIMIVSLSTELARSCLPVSLRHRETQYPDFIIPFITENGRPQRFPIVFYIKAHRYDAIKYACKITFSKIFVDLDTFLIDFLGHIFVSFRLFVQHNCCIDFIETGLSWEPCSESFQNDKMVSLRNLKL